MKVFDYQEKNLYQIPIINENEEFELKLDKNSIPNLENIPSNCSVLSLPHNKISYLSKKMSPDNSLKVLDISFNRLISLSGFERINKLKELNLSNNYIADDQLLFLKSLNELKNLNLSNNNLKTNTISTVIGGLGNLEKLNISNNHLDQIQFDNPCDNLTHLELNSNMLNVIIFKTNFFNLCHLSVSNNKLERIENTNYIKNLEVLIANDNTILNTEFLNKLQSLKKLLLDNNKLIEVKISQNLTTLEKLDLNNNMIKAPTFLVKFDNLISLNLSFNRFTDIYGLVKILKTQKILRDLNLIDNDFNKDYYSSELCGLDDFNCLFEFLQRCGGKDNLVIDYRAFIIVKMPSLYKLDQISISEKERNFVLKGIKDNSFLNKRKSKNLSASNSSLHKKEFKEENFSTFEDPKIKKIGSSLTKENKNINVFVGGEGDVGGGGGVGGVFNAGIGNGVEVGNCQKKNEIFKYIEADKSNVEASKFSTIKTSNEVLHSFKNNNTLDHTNYSDKKNLLNYYIQSNENNKSNIIPTLSIQNNFSQVGKNLTLQENSVPQPIKNPQHLQIYKLIKKTFCRICDKNGFMRLSDCKGLIEDLVKIYNLKDEFKNLVKEIKILCNGNSNLIPGKIHMNDFASLLKNVKYLKVFDVISSKLNDTCMHTGSSSNRFNNQSILSNNSSNNLNFLMSNQSLQSCKGDSATGINFNEDFKKLEMLTSVENSHQYGNNFDLNMNNIFNHNNKYTSLDLIDLNVQKNPRNIKINSNNEIINEIPTGRFFSVKNTDPTLNSNININSNNLKNNFNNNNNLSTFSNNNSNFNRLNNSSISNLTSIPNISTNNNNSLPQNNKNFRGTPLLSTIYANYANCTANNPNKPKYGSSYGNNTNIAPKNNEIQLKNLKNNTQNFLLQSVNNTENKFDINDKTFLRKFLMNICQPPFPLKFSEISNKLFYEIHPIEKEYIFIQNCLSLYSLVNFKLQKFFCLEYYNFLFPNYSSFEFLFENTIYLFYTEYNNTIHNLINIWKNSDIFVKKHDPLILEETPIKFLRNKSHSSGRSVVLCAMIHNNSAESNSISDR